MRSNREVVEYFYEKVFNQHDLSVVDDLMLDSDKQHAPGVADLKEGFMAFITEFVKKEPKTETIKILEDGDLVCIFFKCSFKDGVVAKVFDMYRLENGKLAEHWDCTMRVDNMECKNPNGHF